MKMNSCVALTMGVLFSMNAWAQRNGPTKASQYSSMPMESATSTTSFLSLEPMIGLTYSSFAGVEGKNGATLKSKLGGQGGIAATLGRGDLQFETGLLYSQKGAILEGVASSTIPGLNMKVDYTFNYLDIPLMARYTTSWQKGVNLYLHGGVVLGFLQDSNVEVNGSYWTASFSKSGSSTDNMNSFDPRLAFGVGSTVELSRSIKLIGSVDFQRSVSKVNKESSDEGSDVFNSALALNAGLKFDL